MWLLRPILLLFCPLIFATTLNLRIPANIPALPPTTRAILTTVNHTLRAPVTRSNTFFFRDISPPPHFQRTTENDGVAVSYLLDIACRDYDFMSYGVDVKGGEEEKGNVEIYRVQRGGIEVGGREEVGEDGFELRVLRAREYYEERPGFSPLSLLKNPMILIAIVGLVFVIGMPYLMDSMDPEMRKEFEEQQKKSILSGGANAANPLQNFDMAAWMAGKTAGNTEETSGETTGREKSNVRRRG